MTLKGLKVSFKVDRVSKINKALRFLKFPKLHFFAEGLDAGGPREDSDEEALPAPGDK